MLEEILKDLGEKIVSDAKKDSRKDTGALKASIKYKVKGDTLTVSQLEYGMYQKPNALEVSVDEVITKELNSISEKIMNELTKKLNNGRI